MNNIALTIIWLLVAMGISCQNDNLPGLVASYSFSGNTFDESGSNMHGVIQGAKSTEDRFGHNDRAYRFDGLISIITADVSGMPPVDSPQSICLWFRIDTIPSFKHEMDAHNMIALVDTIKGVGVQFGFRAQGYHSKGFDVWYWGGRTIMESTPPSINRWHFCVYTFDGLQHAFYIDGVKVAESTVSPQTGTPTILMLGNYPGGDQYFAGCIDDVRIYNRPLSQAEVQIIYTEKE